MRNAPIPVTHLAPRLNTSDESTPSLRPATLVECHTGDAIRSEPNRTPMTQLPNATPSETKHKFWLILPPRGWRRRLFIAANVVAIPLFILMLLPWFFAWHGKPLGRDTDFPAIIEARVADAQPPGPDGWQHLVDAWSEADRIRRDIAAQHNLPPEALNHRVFGSTDRWEDGVTQAHVDQYRQALATSSVPKHLCALAKSPRFVRPINPEREILGLLMSILGGARHLGVYAEAVARDAIRDRDHEGVATASEQLLALARLTSFQCFALDTALAGALLVRFAHVVEDAAYQRHLDGPVIEQLLVVMDAQAMRPPRTHVVEAERRVLLDLGQWSHTRRGRALPGELDRLNNLETRTSRKTSCVRDNIDGFALPHADESRRRVDEFYDLVAEDIQTPRIGRSKRDYEAIAAENWLLFNGISSTQKLINGLDLAEATENITRTALHIELHRTRTGSLPESLEALALAPETTRDPMTAADHLRYCLDPQAPLGYRLYSIGLDCIDNGGHPPLEAQDPLSGALLFGALPGRPIPEKPYTRTSP